MAQHYPLPIEVDNAGIPQQGHPRALGKLLAQQKVAVAVDKVNRHVLLAQGQKGVGHLLMERIGVIVANPEFEEIPQHIEGIGAGGVVLESAPVPRSYRAAGQRGECH